MNSFNSLDIEYLRPSRTIESVIVSNRVNSLIFFVYNYEGTSYRVFKNYFKLANFFKDKNEADYHFDTEEELDEFLSIVNLEK